jgi:hypothetical protein
MSDAREVYGTRERKATSSEFSLGQWPIIAASGRHRCLVIEMEIHDRSPMLLLRPDSICILTQQYPKRRAPSSSSRICSMFGRRVGNSSCCDVTDLDIS